MRHLTHWELRSAQTPWRCCVGRSAGFNRFTEYIPPKETGWRACVEWIWFWLAASYKRSEPAKMLEITLGIIGIRSGDQDNDEYQLRPCYQAKTQGPPTFSPETKIRDWCSSWAVTELPPPPGVRSLVSSVNIIRPGICLSGQENLSQTLATGAPPPSALACKHKL